MDPFIDHVNRLHSINQSSENRSLKWSQFAMAFKRAYQSRSNEILTFRFYSDAYLTIGEKPPMFSGVEYEIRKLIAHLFALEAHTPNGLDLGGVYAHIKRSEREFNGLITANQERIVTLIQKRSKMIASCEIDLIQLSRDLFQWEYQKNATNKDYIIKKWVDSYCKEGIE